MPSIGGKMELLLAEPGFNPIEGFMWCLLGVAAVLLILMVVVGGDE